MVRFFQSCSRKLQRWRTLSKGKSLNACENAVVMAMSSKPLETFSHTQLLDIKLSLYYFTFFRVQYIQILRFSFSGCRSSVSPRFLWRGLSLPCAVLALIENRRLNICTQNKSSKNAFLSYVSSGLIPSCHNVFCIAWIKCLISSRS